MKERRGHMFWDFSQEGYSYEIRERKEKNHTHQEEISDYIFSPPTHHLLYSPYTLKISQRTHG